MSQVQIVLDATMLDTLLSCPAKFNYRFNLNRVQREKPKPLDLGGILHIGEEEYFKALKNRIEFKDRLEIARMKMHEAWINDSDLELDEYTDGTSAVLSSITYWRDEDERLEILDVETPFAYVLYEDEDMRIVMIGKIDLLVNEPRFSRIPWDHKSYSREFPLRRLVNQFSNYANATGSMYLKVNRIGLQKSYPPEKKHKRIVLSYDPLILEQWKMNVVSNVKDYIRYAGEQDWPMNLTSCDKYNRICEYHEVCDSSGREAQIYKLETNFHVGEKWDVSAILGKKE